MNIKIENTMRKEISYKGGKYVVFRYEDEWVLPVFSTYTRGLGSPIAMLLFSFEGGEFGYFGDVTVNLPNVKNRGVGCQFIDTNNNGESIMDWLEQNGFGKPTKRSVSSGFCNYPEFNFYKGESYIEFKDKKYDFLL